MQGAPPQSITDSPLQPAGQLTNLKSRAMSLRLDHWSRGDAPSSGFTHQRRPLPARPKPCGQIVQVLNDARLKQEVAGRFRIRTEVDQDTVIVPALSGKGARHRNRPARHTEREREQAERPETQT